MFAETKEWCCIRLEGKAAGERFKLKVWRANVEIWQHPTRAVKKNSWKLI